MADVKKLSKCYLRQGIMLVAGMFFISLIIMRVWNLYEILCCRGWSHPAWRPAS